jgi:hypothetical protein
MGNENRLGSYFNIFGFAYCSGVVNLRTREAVTQAFASGTMTRRRVPFQESGLYRASRSEPFGTAGQAGSNCRVGATPGKLPKRD